MLYRLPQPILLAACLRNKYERHDQSVCCGRSYYVVRYTLAFGTVMVLSARALETNTAFSTYPLPLSSAQQGAGLVAPAAAVAVLGKSGAIVMFVSSYMAVTSVCSAQFISVSSIFTYDVYRVI